MENSQTATVENYPKTLVGNLFVAPVAFLCVPSLFAVLPFQEVRMGLAVAITRVEGCGVFVVGLESYSHYFI